MGLLFGSALGLAIFAVAVLLQRAHIDVFAEADVFFLTFRLPILLCAVIGLVIGVCRSLRGKHITGETSRPRIKDARGNK